MELTKADKIVAKVGTVAALVVCFCFGWINGLFKTSSES